MMKKIILAGNLSYLAALIFCVASFLVGFNIRKELPPPKFAFAEKSAVIFEAVLDRPGMNKQQIEKEVQQPILATLKKYEDNGYVVIDATKDDQGFMSVSAIPTSAIDISSELRTLVKPHRDAK